MKSGSRLNKEFADISTNPIVGATIHLMDENIAKWNVIILGPKKTPYENGKFSIMIDFSDNYPFKAPKIKFMTKIFHPNVKKDTGEICAQVLEEKWLPTLNAKYIIQMIYGILETPNFDSPLDQDVIDAYMKDKKTFETKAKQYTKDYAH